MCLKSVNPIRTFVGYKCVKNRGGYGYISLHNDGLIIGNWERARPTNIDVDDESGAKYPACFHIFTTIKDAVRYAFEDEVVVKVEYRYPLCVGIQKLGRNLKVVVALDMCVVGEVSKRVVKRTQREIEKEQTR